MTFFSRRIKPGPLPPTANPYPSRLQGWRRKILFFSPFILGILSLVLFVLRPPFLEPLSTSLMGSVLSVAQFMGSPLTKTREAIQDVSSLWTLRDDLTRLARENDQLRHRLLTRDALAYEHKKLLEYMYAYPRHFTYATLPVTLVPDGGAQGSFYIATQGVSVERGMGVLSPQGVLGRISEVSGKWARVDVITHRQSRIPVLLETSNESAILVGDGGASPALVYMANPEKIMDGERVLTSGAAGVFPPGLLVGTIESQTPGQARVKISTSIPQSLSTLSFVQVILSERPLE